MALKKSFSRDVYPFGDKSPQEIPSHDTSTLIEIPVSNHTVPEEPAEIEHLFEENDDEELITFTQTVYRLDDGCYRGTITGSRLITDKNKCKKWLIAITMPDNVQFVTTFTMPLNSRTPFGAYIQQVTQNTPSLRPSTIIEHSVAFTVVNTVTSYGLNFCNITKFQFTE